MKIVRSRDFRADRAWGALDIARMFGVNEAAGEAPWLSRAPPNGGPVREHRAAAPQSS